MNLQSCASLFRHGKSGYSQGNGEQTLQTANDLLSESIEFVRQNALRLARSLKCTGPKIHIHTSPTGRTIHTARIIHMVMQEQGQDVDEPVIDHNLGEVQNFSWELFEPLMNGGKIPWNNTHFEVDKALTNPQGLGYPDYFMEDAVHAIAPEVLQGWPTDFVERIQSFEKFWQVNRRTYQRISRVIYAQPQEHDNTHHHVFVTHDASAMDFVNQATNGAQKSLEPGTFMLLTMRNSGLVVVELNGVEINQPEE